MFGSSQTRGLSSKWGRDSSWTQRAAEPISGFSCSWNNKQNFRALMRREKSVGMKLKNLIHRNLETNQETESWLRFKLCLDQLRLWPGSSLRQHASNPRVPAGKSQDCRQEWEQVQLLLHQIEECRVEAENVHSYSLMIMATRLVVASVWTNGQLLVVDNLITDIVAMWKLCEHRHASEENARHNGWATVPTTIHIA